MRSPANTAQTSSTRPGGGGDKAFFNQQRTWVDLLQLSLEGDTAAGTTAPAGGGEGGGGGGEGGVTTCTRNMSESDLFGSTFSWASASTSTSADSSVIWSKGSGGGGEEGSGGGEERGEEVRRGALGEHEEESGGEVKGKKSCKAAEPLMGRRGYSTSDLLGKGGDREDKRNKKKRELPRRLQTSTSSLFDIPLPLPERKPLQLSPYLVRKKTRLQDCFVPSLYMHIYHVYATVLPRKCRASQVYGEGGQGAREVACLASPHHTTGSAPHTRDCRHL